MSLYLKETQRKHLALLQYAETDVVELCRVAFDYLNVGPNVPRYEQLAKKYAAGVDAATVQCAVEALIALLIDATKARADRVDMPKVLRQTFPELNEDILDVLAQFVSSKRNFVEGSIKTANIRAYRLVNLEWRLEVRTATRSLLNQSSIRITMKLYLHTEPKNENRDLLELDGIPASKDNSTERQVVIHEDEKRNRKDLLVQTDLNSLVYIIKTLEDALIESKTRRIRNIVDAIH